MGQGRWLICGKQTTTVGLGSTVGGQGLIAAGREQVTQVYRQATFPNTTLEIDNANTPHVLMISTGSFLLPSQNALITARLCVRNVDTSKRFIHLTPSLLITVVSTRDWLTVVRTVPFGTREDNAGAQHPCGCGQGPLTLAAPPQRYSPLA